MSEHLDYWKYYPEKWLLSDKVREMPLVAVAGYRFLCDHCMLEPLPGILPLDDKKLQKWARMSPREWERNRLTILANFVSLSKKDAGAVLECLGQPFVMQLFRQYDHQKWDASTQGKLSIAKRWGKTQNSPSKIAPYRDPYEAYTKKVVGTTTTTPPQPLSVGALGVVTGSDGDVGDVGCNGASLARDLKSIAMKAAAQAKENQGRTRPLAEVFLHDLDKVVQAEEKQKREEPA